MQKSREIIYVCSAIKENVLISKMIDSSTIDESCFLFEKEQGIKPQIVLGPFYKRKTGILKKNFDIKFKLGEHKQCKYDGWNVTAMPLSNPPDSVYVFYNERTDGQKMPKPKAIVVNKKDIQGLE